MIGSASSQTSRVLSPESLLNRTELESDIGALVEYMNQSHPKMRKATVSKLSLETSIQP